MTLDLDAPICDWMPVRVYPGHRPGMPDVVVGRWPPEAGRTGSARWKSWICETPDEYRDVMARLGEPCPRRGAALDFRAGPDGALQRRASGMAPIGELVVGLYPPPEADWPWLVVVSLPVADPQIERGRYAWEAFEREADALGHMARMAGRAGRPVHILRPPLPT